MSDNPAKHEVLIKQYLCSILDISAFMPTTIIYVKDCFLSAYVFFLIIPLVYCKPMVQNNNE